MVLGEVHSQAQNSNTLDVTEHHGKTAVVALATLLIESELTRTEKLFGYGGLLNGKSPRWHLTYVGHRGITPTDEAAEYSYRGSGFLV